MSSQSNSSGEAVSDREIVSTRVFEAPRETVFRAWTDPDHLARWWGPKGFTNTLQEFDSRPGGIWRFVMHGPDGKAYKNKSVFIEVVKPERIVFQHVSGPQFQAGDLRRAGRQDQTRVSHALRDCRRMRKDQGVRRRCE